MTEHGWRIPPMLRQPEEREEPAPPEPIAPKEPEAPKPVPPEKEAAKAHPELVLDVSPEEVRPGAIVHVSCANVPTGVGVLVIEAPHHRWEQYARDAANGFTVPLAVAGTYRLALRQPDDKERWSEQARLTVEVVEQAP